MTSKRSKVMIQRFMHSHLDSAASLAVKSYNKQYKMTPFLPDDLKKEVRMRNFLEEMISNYPGIVAMQDGEVIGYFTGRQILSYQGRINAIYIPEWGHYADTSRPELYYNMYKELASIWIDRGYSFHMISVFSAHDLVQETISWLGFGKYVMDGIMNAKNFSLKQDKINTDYNIRIGTTKDLHILSPLGLELEQYLARAPIFLHKETSDIQFYKKWVNSPDHIFWLAFDDRTPIGFIQIESGAEDVSSIVQDPGSVSITGLYVSPSYRNRDIGKRLLEQAVNWTIENGQKRLCVDFESVNNLGREFWLKYFKPFSFSYYRYTL